VGCRWPLTAAFPFNWMLFGVAQSKAFLAHPNGHKLRTQANILLHCSHSSAFARMIKHLGRHDVGNGSSILSWRFTTSAHPKSQAQTSNFAKFAISPPCPKKQAGYNTPRLCSTPSLC
jgi:hypothetical protein